MSQQRDWAQIMKNNILLEHLIQQQQTKELIIVLLSLAYSAFLKIHEKMCKICKKKKKKIIIPFL